MRAAPLFPHIAAATIADAPIEVQRTLRCGGGLFSAFPCRFFLSLFSSHFKALRELTRKDVYTSLLSRRHWSLLERHGSLSRSRRPNPTSLCIYDQGWSTTGPSEVTFEPRESHVAILGKSAFPQQGTKQCKGPAVGTMLGTTRKSAHLKGSGGMGHVGDEIRDAANTHTRTESSLRSRSDINREMVTMTPRSLGLMSKEAAALMLMNSDDLERSLN